MSPAEDVLVDVVDGVARVTLNRPDVYNAVHEAMLGRFADHMERLADDDGVRSVVVTGAGKAFCSGADLARAGTGGVDQTRRVMAAMGRAVSAITAAPQPVIAAVNGPAAGGGASLALVCDLVVASRAAYFLFPFVGVGLIPDGGATLTVAASIGRARAMRMALRQERLPAADAYAAGLIAAVCEPDELDPLVTDWATGLAAGARNAMAAAKRAVNAATLGQLRQVLRHEADRQTALAGGPEFAEGVAAFRERRRPAYRDIHWTAPEGPLT